MRLRVVGTASLVGITTVAAKLECLPWVYQGKPGSEGVGAIDRAAGCPASRHQPSSNAASLGP